MKQNTTTNKAGSSHPHPISMKSQLMKFSISLHIWKAKDPFVIGIK